MIGAPARVSIAALAAVVAYLALAACCAASVGIVGEVAIGWALPEPPRVLASLDPPGDGVARAGPFEARVTRPTASLVVGGARLPLAVNAYTGGPPDWPARAARAITGRVGAGQAVNVGLGALLLLLAHRFLRFYGSPIAAGAAALVLATDWCFVFYRKVLGGTEVLLQAAALLVLWSLWSRRWRGGVHGTVAIAVGVGLGLLAKATFACTLAAFAVAVLATRWDHPDVKPPVGVRASVLVGIPAVCLAPLAAAWALHAALPLPAIPSHDSIALQLGRLGTSGGRETAWNLACFLGDPRASLAAAWGTVALPPVSPLRAIGFGVLVAGTALEWRTRTKSPAAGLLRFLSIFVPAQIAMLFAANRDLHHLAQATTPLALWMGLAVDRLAGELAPPRSWRRALAAGVLVLPMAIAGVRQLAGTDAVVATARARTFTEDGQAALVGALRGAGVERLVTSDYEVYGMLEARAPEIAVVHTWPAIAAKAARADVLRAARGGHYLSVRPSAPMIYDWAPAEADVRRVAAEAGVTVTLEASLSDGQKAWATVWRVE
ncbi:MAG: hypothetical protein ACOZNI_23965 [Myxococcota bacterium]